MLGSLSKKQTLGIILLGAISMNLAYYFESLGILTIIYLAGMFALAFAPNRRWAFYGGFTMGMLVFVPQLHFFLGLFGGGALALHAILALWLAAFAMLSHVTARRWPKWGMLLLPVFWVALEYFRCELYPLRFAWLTPGLALSHNIWRPLSMVGVHGFSFIIMLSLAAGLKWRASQRYIAITYAVVLVALLVVPSRSAGDKPGPYVAGVQLEDVVSENKIVASLDRLIETMPETELVVLSEYTFAGPVPECVLQWCRRNKRHLVVGGKDPIDNDKFYNTAFVVDPNGEIIFKQVKSVPIQFFDDGLPAPEQKLWQSPWGKIGLAVCYDLAYSRVIDRLVDQGAEAIIVPTMDGESWGRHEHIIHSRITPVRAREYGVPIFRVASSGISQLIDSNGVTLASAPFPGQGEMLGGQMSMTTSAAVPLGRYIALPCVAITGFAALFMLIFAWGRKSDPHTGEARNTVLETPA